MAVYGSRTIGDTIEGVGTIEQVSLTAYRVGTVWVPMSRVDDMTPAEPLVTFGGESHPIHRADWATGKTATVAGFTVTPGPANNELLKDADGVTVAVRPAQEVTA